MRPHLAVSALVAGLCCIGSASAEEKPAASPFSANITLTSDYAYRGISQTDERPALQGGFDFKHSSGAYIGTWASNVSWLRDAERGTNSSSGNSLEIDVYAGYAKKFGDFTLDAGLWQYLYPGHYSHQWKNETGLKNPATFEAYAIASWKFLSFKYSHAFTNLFGAPRSKGSAYYDLSASYELFPNLKLNAHYGYQRIKGPSADSYSDWKLGAIYTLKGIDLGLHYVDTDISHGGDTTDSRIIFSIGTSF